MGGDDPEDFTTQRDAAARILELVTERGLGWVQRTITLDEVDDQGMVIGELRGTMAYRLAESYFPPRPISGE